MPSSRWRGPGEGDKRLEEHADGGKPPERARALLGESRTQRALGAAPALSQLSSHHPLSGAVP
jgi:hypothetical protein